MRITLYLLRDGVELSADVLRDGASFQEVELRAIEGISWKLFVRQNDPKEASWVAGVRPLAADKVALEQLRTQSSAGVLLAEVKERVFAVTFSHGFHAINSKHVEPGFGLRVTANVIAADQVTSADTKGFSRSSRSQKTVLPAASELFALGIETSEEWVRQLSGKVTAQDFATTASGADSLKLSIKNFSLNALPGKLAEIVDRYEAKDYEQDFGFLDNFIRIDKKDPIVEELDAAVEALFLARSSDLGFAAPDPFEQRDVDHFCISYRKKIRVEELTTDEVYAALGELTLPKVDPMHRVSVLALSDDENLVDRAYDLYNYIQAEILRPEGRYALTVGAWFRIAASYLEEVDNFLQGVDDITVELDLPDWSKELLDQSDEDPTTEGTYNVLLSNDRGYELLDKKNLYFGYNQKIEICDVLTPDRQMLCVKRASKSSTLSHLFAQGSVSASLMNEPKYQKRIMEHLRKLDASADFGNQSDWKFVYAIATEKPGRLADTLFFFSKVNLVTHVREIQSRGFKAAVAKIAVV